MGLGKEGLLIYVLTSLVFITFSLIYKPKYENTVRNEKRKLGVHLVISTFLVQTMGLLFKTFYVYDLLTSILFTIVTYTFYKIFSNSIPVIYEYGSKKAFTIEEVIGSGLLISIAISFLGNFSIFGFNVKNIACILIVLVLGWKNGVLVGTTGGVTIGVVLGIIGKGDPILLASFALSGMIAGILNRFGKIGVIAGFILGNAILTYAATGNDLVSYVTLKLNGKNSNIEKDIKLEKKTDKDGKTYYKGHTENENSSFDVELYDVENLDNYSIEATEYTEDKNGTKEYNVTVGIETKKERKK